MASLPGSVIFTSWYGAAMKRPDAPPSYTSAHVALAPGGVLVAGCIGDERTTSSSTATDGNALGCSAKPACRIVLAMSAGSDLSTSAAGIGP